MPTITYAKILDIVGKQIPKIAEMHLAGPIANLGLNLIWHAYDWRPSLKPLPPFYIVSGEQDHFRPIANVPDDFWGLRKAFLTRILNGLVEHMEMSNIKDLRVTNMKALPEAICYDPTLGNGIGGYRVYPRMPQGLNSPNYFVTGTYKATAPIISASTINTTLPWSDQYLNTYIAVFRWAAYEAMGDQRAGGIQMSGGQKYYSGQFAAAMEGIDSMAAWEGVNDGDPVIAPRHALVGNAGTLNFPWNLRAGF